MFNWNSWKEGIHFKAQTIVASFPDLSPAFSDCMKKAGKSLGISQGTRLSNKYKMTYSHPLQIPGIIEGVKFESQGARYILVVEKDAVFTYLCGQRIWDTLPCIVITGCGYPPLSVRAVVKQLATQFRLPVVGLFDYNPHGARILLTYKFGSTRMGLEAHAYAVDIKWLGVHHDDILGADNRVPESALQQWSISDERVHAGVSNQVELMNDPYYSREVKLMAECRVKAEIEALNSSGFDSLEQKIIQKILRKAYF